MPQLTEISADIESGGKIKILASEIGLASDTRISITYFPDTQPSEPIYFGSRDVSGMGNMLPLTREADGTWQAEIIMKANESREFSMHIGHPTGPPDFSSDQHFKSKICLMEGELIDSVYEDPNLSDVNKGRVEKRIYTTDGKLSAPLPLDYEIREGEEVVEVYIPAQYSSENKYPVHIFLDGDMHTSVDSFGNRLETPNILDNLISKGKMEPVIAIFTSPSTLSIDGSNQRLREYACNPITDNRLANLPKAIYASGLSVKTDGATLCGQSLGGLQAIYTAKMHPDVFAKVIAQSPALWWEPPQKLEGEKAFYEIDCTWRHPLRKPFPMTFPIDKARHVVMAAKSYKGYIHRMLETGVDQLTGARVPEGKVEIVLQAGTHESGTISALAGFEPLIQATKTLAEQLDIDVIIHDGAHSPEPWASGLATILPVIEPRLLLTGEGEHRTSFRGEASGGASSSSRAEAISDEFNNDSDEIKPTM